MDYKQFRSQFDFIFLSGLKGQERVCEIQDKKTNRMYDYKEVIKEGDDIEKQMDYCSDFLMTINHPNILKLITYSYCFIEEHHGAPYCKFFLVFEYCESSLDRELQTLLRKKKFIKTPRLYKIFSSLISSLIYLHGKQSIHRELIPEFVCVTEKDEYKLMPQIQVKSTKSYKFSKYKKNLKKIYETKPNIHKPVKKIDTKSSKRVSISPPKSPKTSEFHIKTAYNSPEMYENEKNRVAYHRLVINPYVSEAFSLGMLLLSVGILENLEDFYKTFKVDEEFLKEKMLKFQNLHGQKLTLVLSKLLEINPDNRSSLDSTLSFLTSEDQIPVKMATNFSLETKVHDNKSPLKPNSFKNKKTMKNHRSFTEDNEDLLESSFVQKIFNQLPQEYQDEIDRIVSDQMRIIEDEKYPTDMYSSGDRYQGEKENEIPHGWGIYWWANGERYEGYFNKGKYDGEGIYYWPTGTKHYGEFINGEITGIGVRYYPDGGIYYGQWEKGKNHGKGTYFWMTGAKYQGGFIEDMIYGKGILTWPEEDGKTVRHYEGLWKDVNPKGITVEQIKQSQIKN